MSPEKIPHVPEVKTTPEIVLEKEGVQKKEKKERPLSPEELESRVSEHAELSASRAEVAKHVNEAWGVKSKTELAELKTFGRSLNNKEREAVEKAELTINPLSGKYKIEKKTELPTDLQEIGNDKESQAVAAHLEALSLDPELAEFQETTLRE